MDGVIHAGTTGLFELIFKRIHDDAIYTEEDKQKYKSLLLATNVHRRGHNFYLYCEIKDTNIKISLRF
jgi:hypothetical protein